MVSFVAVTHEDIRLGQRFQPNLCPLAQAFRRALGKQPWEVSVSPRGVLIASRTHSPLPWRARLFVYAFDWLPHCWPFVCPFTFTWEV